MSYRVGGLQKNRAKVYSSIYQYKVVFITDEGYYWKPCSIAVVVFVVPWEFLASDGSYALFGCQEGL
jgi:hypothetical protein